MLKTFHLKVKKKIKIFSNGSFRNFKIKKFRNVKKRFVKNKIKNKNFETLTNVLIKQLN